MAAPAILHTIAILSLIALAPFVVGKKRHLTTVQCDVTEDVTIVGAGVSGTYAAYQLRTSGQTIGVYEYSDRNSGRLYTADMAGSQHRVELGGMRYVDGVHTRVQRLIKEFGLTPTVFPEGFGRSGRTRLYLRGKSLTLEDTKTGDVPYNLTAEEKANQANIWGYYLEKLTGVQVEPGTLTREMNMGLKVHDGRYLYELTFDEALDLVASSEGKQFARDTMVFQSLTVGDVSASTAFDDTLGVDGAGGEVYTIEEGMSSIPQNLLSTFLDESAEHSVSYNQQLLSIDKQRRRPYVLTFGETVTQDGYTRLIPRGPQLNVCTDTVILAVPVAALDELKWSPLKKCRALQAYKAVRSIPASKVFLTFDSAWWSHNGRPANVTKSDEPFSQMYDWWTGSNGGPYTLLASYSDLDNSMYEKMLWGYGDLIDGSATGFGRVTKQLSDFLLDELAEAYNVPRASIPAPITGLSQFWSEFPFGGGWTVWRSGYNIEDTQRLMQRPSKRDNVFVVGSDFAFGLRAPWAEGGLETVDQLLESYFY